MHEIFVIALTGNDKDEVHAKYIQFEKSTARSLVCWPIK